MRTWPISVFIFLLFFPCSSFAQQTVVKTTVCEVATHPVEFDNKFVELRATVVSDFEVFAIRDSKGDCGVLWLTFPGKGPTAMTTFGSATPKIVRLPVTLQRDARFVEFETKLNEVMHPKHRGWICISCNRYEITALLVGRVDYAGDDSGFGHLNGYKQQFVLRSVSEVIAKDLAPNYDAAQYSKDPVRFPSGLIVGKVIGPNGKPVARANVDAVSTVDVALDLSHGSAQTDEHGKFKLEVPPGSYVVGINLEHPASQAVPFAPTYYPQTTKREEAQVFDIADWQTATLTMKLENTLEPKIVPVHVSWPDGSPVQDANVWLSEESSPRTVVGQSVSHTDAGGNFKLTGFPGIRYVVHANIYKKPGYVPFCAENQTIEVGAVANEPLVFVLTITGDVCRRRD